MNVIENKIVQLLTGKPALQDVGISELEAITAAHRYFTVSQLLLTRKMKQEQHPGFSRQLQKTALHFPNPHWLHLHITSEELISEPFIVLPEHPQKDSELVAPDNNDGQEQIALPVTAENRIETAEMAATIAEENREPYNGHTGTFLITEHTESTHSNNAETENTQQPAHVYVPEPVPIKPDFVEEEQLIEETTEPITDKVLHEDNLRESITEVVTAEKHPQEIIEAAEQHSIVMEDIDEDDLPLPDEYDTTGEREKISSDIPNMKLAEMLQNQAAAFNKPVEAEDKLPIETEPYHTVDYFASQGIKVEALQPDQLGNKVRRFTDWLKQMKRVAPQPADLGTESEMEHIIQDIAAISNEAKEIVTEAMAEVLIKQGKTGKAIQLYQKLSFLNPDKSAYFAAKIEQLKSI